MYHPYQHLEAKRTVNERRERADMARRTELIRGDRAKRSVHLLARLIALIGGDRINSIRHLGSDRRLYGRGVVVWLRNKADRFGKKLQARWKLTTR